MKKVIAVILTLIMVLSFAGCSKKPSGNDIVVGCYMPLTGTNAGSGLCGVRGMQYAFDEINEAGGIGGRKIVLESLDSAGTTEGATKAATRLIEEKGVKVLAGSFLSSSVLAVSSLTERAKVLHVGTGTGATWTNCGLEYTYRATTNGNLPVETMAEELVDCGMKSIALISVSSEYGQSGHDAVVAACQSRNIEIKTDVLYQSADTDFSGVISRVLKENADTIVMYGLGQEMAMITKQLRQAGYNKLLFTIEGGANSEMFTVAGDTSNGLVFAAAYVIPATPEEAATELMKGLLEKYVAEFNEMPYSDVFFRGYDQGRLIAEALKNAEDPDDGESIMKAYKAISGLELLGGSFDYTEGTGDGLKEANRWMILDGKIRVYDKAALKAYF